MDGQIALKKEGAREYSIERLADNADFKGFMCVMQGLDARGIKVGFVAAPPPQR